MSTATLVKPDKTISFYFISEVHKIRNLPQKDMNKIAALCREEKATLSKISRHEDDSSLFDCNVTLPSGRLPEFQKKLSDIYGGLKIV